MKIAAIALLMFAGTVHAQEWPYDAKGMDTRLSELAAQSPTLKAALDEIAADSGRTLVFNFARLPGELIGATQYSGKPGKYLAEIFLDLDKAAFFKITDQEWKIILLHEVYAHAVPFLETGVPCTDPQKKESFSHSCVGKREAVIMAELGLKPRSNYAIRP